MQCKQCHQEITQINGPFCHHCGTAHSVVQNEGQQSVPPFAQPAQQMPSPWVQTTAIQQTQEKDRLPVWVIVVTVLSVLAVLVACAVSTVLIIDTALNLNNERSEATLSLTGEDEQSGSTESEQLDWASDAHAVKEAVLAFLEDKYGEKFEIEYYPNDSWGIVWVYPARNPGLSFTVQYKENDVLFPADELKDDFREVLAGEIAGDKILPLLEDLFDSQEMDHFFVLYSLLANNTFGFFMEDSTWEQEDGLDAFIDPLEVEAYLSINISLHNQDVFDEIDEADIKVLAEDIVQLGIVVDGGWISISSPLGWTSHDGLIMYRWYMHDGNIVGGRFE